MAVNIPPTDLPLSKTLEKLKGDLDLWFERAVSQGEKALGAIGISGMGKGWMPPVDIIETNEELIVHADLPGIGPDDVELELAGNMLTIKGNKPTVELPDGAVLHSSERGDGAFSRSIPLPVAVDAGEVSAQSNDGVLVVRLGKAHKVHTTQIPVNKPHECAGEAAHD